MLSPHPQRRLPLDIYLFTWFLMPLWLFHDATQRRSYFRESDDGRFEATNTLLALIQSPSASNARSAAEVFIGFGMLMFFVMLFCFFAFFSDNISLAWTFAPTLLAIITWIEIRRLLSWADQTEE